MQALTETLLDRRGQDLVEYALVASLISLAAIVGMKSAATAIGAAYNSIATKFAGFVS
jgi:Flp pilus assembly pilin Flp